MSYESREAYNARKRAAETRRSAALVSSAISARTRRRRWHHLNTARGVVQLARGGGSLSLPLSTGAAASTRGCITAWSDKSKQNLQLAAAQIEWPALRVMLVTLTYPRHFSADPAEWKNDLRRVRHAWTRRHGQPLALWALEFQQRGAPHFHLAIVVPPGVRSSELREWIAQTWYRIAGHGDVRHLKQHRKPDHAKLADSHQGVSAYLRRELGKERQKDLPAWLRESVEKGGAGRWWGIWGLRRVVRQVRLSPREFGRVAKVMHRVHDQRDVQLGEQLQLQIGNARDPDELRRLQRRLHRVAMRRARRRVAAGFHGRRGLMLFDRTRSPWGLTHLLLSFVALIRGEPPPAIGSFIAIDRAASHQLVLEL